MNDSLIPPSNDQSLNEQRDVVIPSKLPSVTEKNPSVEEAISPSPVVPESTPPSVEETKPVLPDTISMNGATINNIPENIEEIIRSTIPPSQLIREPETILEQEIPKKTNHIKKCLIIAIIIFIYCMLLILLVKKHKEVQRGKIIVNNIKPYSAGRRRDKTGKFVSTRK